MSVVSVRSSREQRITIRSLARRKRRGERFAMLTAYDFAFARIFDDAGIDVLLVGDSLANVVQGEETTLPVTLEEMIYHTRLVARAARRALVVGDMPFGSYQVSPEDAVRNAARERVLADARVACEAGAFAVGLEAMPPELAREITQSLEVPTIGIGAGPDCDGQVLVMHDLLGLTDGWSPTFVKQYASRGALASQAARSFAEEVDSGKFPSHEHCYR